jgi:hypothetical protein
MHKERDGSLLISFTATTCKNNTSSKYEEHEEGENLMMYLQSNKMLTASILNQKEPKEITLVEETDLHITISKQNLKKKGYVHLILKIMI